MTREHKVSRTWKAVRKERHSSMRKDKGIKQSYLKRIATSKDADRVRQIGNKLKEARSERKRAKRIREEDKQQKKLENEKRSEVVMPIKNTDKIKRMKKNQLRTIVKR